MKLTVLGSGTSELHPKRSSSAYWLETSAGSVLLDCSASALHRMAQENLDWPGLDAIWISHFHLDHVGGLAPYLFATRYAKDTQTRIKPLKIFGAKGLRALIEAFDGANDYKLFKQPFPLEIFEVEPLEKFTLIDGLESVAASIPHIESSLALHLMAPNGKTMVYTSDTGFSMTVGAFARSVDLLLMECSFVKDKPVATHLELAEAVHLIRYAAPKRTVLTHLYSEWDEVDFDEIVARFDPMCDVIQAFDGLTIDI